MIILVTGASKGIGREVVKQFSLLDNHTILAISRNENALFSLAKECKRINEKSIIIPLAVDLNLFIQQDKVSKKIFDLNIRHIDILINNAGLLISKPFHEFKIEDAKNIFDVNFFSTAMLINKLLPQLGKESKSHIVNISSMGGFQGSAKYPGLSYYSASKAAIANLTECLASEYSESNIVFNCLALGAVQTEMLSEAFPHYRAPLNAKEMSEFVVNFALNGHKFFNGKILPVALSNP